MQIFPAAKTDLVIALSPRGVVQKESELINAVLFKLSEINTEGKEKMDNSYFGTEKVFTWAE